MTRLADVAAKIRSKNAGPFWLTIDIFCGSEAAYQRIGAALENDSVAARFRIDPDQLRRFDLPRLAVVKFSLPRPAIQGTGADRDMHGASFANLLADIPV